MNTFRSNMKYKDLYKILKNLFSPRDKKLFGLMILVQVLLGFLDLAAVILIGLVALTWGEWVSKWKNAT